MTSNTNYYQIIQDSLSNMGIYDVFNYAVYDNPVSKTLCSYVSTLTTKGNNVSLTGSSPPSTLTIVRAADTTIPLWKMARETGPFIRIAGVSGALAIALGAYGAHRTYPKDRGDELKQVFEIANKMHMFHTLALFGVPFCRYPILTGAVLITGTALFSGACYSKAFTGDNKFGKLAPVGGMLLIVGWATMIL